VSNVVFDFTELRRYREKIVVAVAGAVQSTFYEDHADAPLVPAFDLMELANEFRTAGADWIETDYRATCLIVAMKKRGVQRIPKREARRFDPAAHHADTVAWARDLLDQTQPGLARRIFAEWGRQ
jgi:hypothetical protein